MARVSPKAGVPGLKKLCALLSRRRQEERASGQRIDARACCLGAVEMCVRGRLVRAGARRARASCRRRENNKPHLPYVLASSA